MEEYDKVCSQQMTNKPANLKPEIKSEPELLSMHNRLKSANGEYSLILSSIEEKLHNILNLRHPECAKDNTEMDEQDYVSSMRKQLIRMEECNSRLVVVLNHLIQII